LATKVKTNSIEIQTPNSDLKGYRIKVSEDCRVQVGKRVWIVRIVILAIVASFPIYRFLSGAKFGDPFIIYSTLMPAIVVVIYFGAWFWYKNPTKRKEVGSVNADVNTGANTNASDNDNSNEDDLVSVILPIYNQQNMIEVVIDAIYRSTYKNIEIIAVNDGSIDGTKEILDKLTVKYPTLNVIHQERGGKRKASAAGFYLSKGNYMVHLDSDSVIDENAITELIKGLKSNPNIGCAVGEIRIWNANESLLTKLQDAWHNSSCNVNKAYESVFRCVTCCSGSLAAYKREAIADFMPYWADSNLLSGGGVDRELTAFVVAPQGAKSALLQTLWPSSHVKQKLMESAAGYDDADDRMLTAQSLVKWESVYVVTATTYVEGQETWKGFLKQQTRWKKGFLRTNFYLSTYFWKDKHPFASLIYYLDFMAGLTTPFVILTVLIYEPLVLHLLWTPMAFIAGLIFSGLAHGIDMKLRCRSTRIWKYLPLMNLFGTFVVTWVLFAALWNYKKNSWMTR
jgi:hyaluronan synthase